MSIELVPDMIVDIELPNNLPVVINPPSEGDTETVTVSAIGGTPTGPAGGVLSGNYPNPGFSQAIATQGFVDIEVTAHALDPEPHTAYDDMVPLTLFFENGLV